MHSPDRSCPIVHLGDLAKIRVKKKKTCALRGSIGNATKVCDTTTIDKKGMGSFTKGLCNPYEKAMQGTLSAYIGVK